MSAPIVFRWIAARLTRRTCAWIAIGGALGLVGRLGGLATALFWADDKARLAIVVGVATVATFVLRRAVTSSARVDAECDLHRAVARSLLDCDVIEEPVAEPHFALAEGIYTATELATQGAPTLVVELIASAFAAFALASVMTAQSLALASVAAGVLAILTVALRARVARLHGRAIEARQHMANAFTTTLHGRLELVASHAESSALARVAGAADRYRREARTAAIGVALLGRAPLAAAILVCGAIVAWSGGASLIAWTADAKPLVVLAAALPIPISLIFCLQEMLRYREQLRPFAEVVLRPPRPDVSRHRATEAQAPLAAPPSIELEAVSFAYHDDGQPILDRLGVAFGPSNGKTGGLLVLRGPNGSGKTTALRLILGLRDPDAGSVRAAGIDLRALDLPALRGRMSFLPQRPYLGEPHATIAESLRLLAPDASPIEMRDAITRVGLDGTLGQRGADPLVRRLGELSVGQRQRVALARVLVRDSDVVLLDEPDANLDPDGIARLVTIIEALAERRLVAVAAHGPITTSLGGEVWNLEPPA